VEEVVIVSTLTAEIFLNLLEQDEIWVTGDGRRMALDEMERSHRRNVLTLLEHKHRYLYREWLTEFLDDGVRLEELEQLGWVAWDPAIGRHRPAGARTWFERQPLILRLRALLGPPGWSG
jgi:hypothetical protein